MGYNWNQGMEWHNNVNKEIWSLNFEIKWLKIFKSLANCVEVIAYLGITQDGKYPQSFDRTCELSYILLWVLKLLQVILLTTGIF